MAHALFAPSKMQRTIACPASIAMERDIPDHRSSYADEGTVAHDMAARCLKAKKDAIDFIGMSAYVDSDGEVTWSKDSTLRFKVNQDFADYVQVYLNSVRRRAHGKLLLVEQRVSFAEACGVEGQSGTADVVIYDEETGHLWVMDLKFGQGVKVFAENNEQMMTYGVGTIETFRDILGDIKIITLVISQPRLDHEDEWDCTPADLQVFTKKMREAVTKAECAIAIMDDGKEIIDVYFGPGKKQCGFCKASATCSALRQLVSKTVLDDFQALDDPQKASVGPLPRLPGRERLGDLYGFLGVIEDWAKAVRTETERLVVSGETIIGSDGQPMKTVEGRAGNRAWIDEATAEGALTGVLTGDKAYSPRKIITPAAADKLLNKKKTAATWETIKKLYRSPPGRPQVVLGSDPRPPYSGEAQASEFDDLDDPTL